MGFAYAVGTAGTLACPAGAPFLGKKWGKEPLFGGSSPLGPLLWWGCVGEAVLLTGYPACGPHIGRPVTARPPAGRAGGVNRYPLGKGGENHSVSHFSSRQRTTSPARPSRWAGHEALVLEAAGQAHTEITTFPFPPPENGVPRGRNLLPLVFFPLFLQRNRAPPGRAPFPPVPTAWRKEPAPRQTDRNTPPPQENQFNKENNLWNASNPGPCPVLWSSCPPGKPSLSGCWRPSAPPMPSTASPRWTPPSLNRRRSSWPKAAAKPKSRSTASPRGQRPGPSV